MSSPGRPGPRTQLRSTRAPRPPRDGRTWIWTDGSFHSDTEVGGWAWATRDGLSAHGALPRGLTSEHMELYAIRQALESHHARSATGLLIFCDHQGVVHNLNRSPRDFRAWASSTRRDPALAPTLIALDLLLHASSTPPTQFRWTRAHARDHMNRTVDRLARRARARHEATLATSATSVA